MMESTSSSLPSVSDARSRGLPDDNSTSSATANESDWRQHDATSDSEALVDAPGLPTDGAEQQWATETKVYKSRYWVLFIYSLILSFQAMVWNTWGPISASALYAYPNWTDTTIAAFSNWGPCGFIVMVMPVSWLINKKGLRPVTVVMSGVCVIGHVLRCVTIEPVLFTVFAHICAALNGFLATIVLAAAMLPALWFPAEQRVTATAFSTVLNQMGAGGSFLEPLMVRSPSNETSREEVREDIRTLCIVDLGISVGLFLAVLSYFPSAPALPPTPSSAVPRYDFTTAFRTIARNAPFWLLVIPYSVFVGISSAWISVVSFSLYQFDFTQNQIGMLGVYVSLSIGVVSLGSAFLADKFYGRLKLALLVLMLLSSLSYTWFLLMSINVITPTKAQVYVAVLAGQSFNFAATPFFFELCCEAVYPTPESVPGTVATLFNNIVGAVFLGLYYIPQIVNSGPDWMTYMLVGSNFGMMIPVIFAKENYHRSRLDRSNLD